MTALIIAAPEDVHARAVAFELGKLGCRSHIIPTSAIPTETSLSFSISSSVTAGASLSSSRRINVEELNLRTTSVWWRRPNGHGANEQATHPKIREFIYNENRHALIGAILSACPVFFNDFAKSMTANYKPYQLSIARELGFCIPATLITTDPQAAMEFWKSNNRDVIYKTFTGVDFGLYETRLLAEADLADIERIRCAPIILQQHVRGLFDLRVTVVGDDMFCAALYFKEGKHPVDSRVDRYRIERFIPDEAFKRRVLQLVRRFGLVYGALDFRMTEDSDLVFFELNPEGQYLWTEIEAELPISAAIAQILARGSMEKGCH